MHLGHWGAMQLDISVRLAFDLPAETDFLLQIEAAPLPEQEVVRTWIGLSPTIHFARIAGQDGIGERIWLRADGRFGVDYVATVIVRRGAADLAALAALPPHRLPGETVQYLFDSPYCPADRFHAVAETEFADTAGGARIAAIRDWISHNIAYTPGASGSTTTALDTYVERHGVCRDFAHVLIALARASGIPARYAAVYAPRVAPQDFHAVAEVFLADPAGTGGAWHLVDATGMADPAEMAKIGIGRDAADVSFLTTFGGCTMAEQSIFVTAGPAPA